MLNLQFCIRDLPIRKFPLDVRCYKIPTVHRSVPYLDEQIKCQVLGTISTIYYVAQFTFSSIALFCVGAYLYTYL